MYTHFNNLYINKKGDSALLNSSYVQNVHHQHPCIVDNNLQHSGILLALLAVEGRQFFFQLHAACCSVLGFLCTKCSAEYTTSKVKWAIVTDTLIFPYSLLIFQENEQWGNFSHNYSNEVAHHPVERMTHAPKTICWLKVQ